MSKINESARTSYGKTAEDGSDSAYLVFNLWYWDGGFLFYRCTGKV